MHIQHIAAACVTHIAYGFHATPFGMCLIGCIQNYNICYLAFTQNELPEQLAPLQRAWPHAQLEPHQEFTQTLVDQLFKHDAQLDTLELAIAGTPFQEAVWQALLAITAGTTTTYEAIAQQIGRPTAVRAVASAIGANNIAWLIPCHRVVRKDGGLGGYRWGITHKHHMLAFEKKLS